MGDLPSETWLAVPALGLLLGLALWIWRGRRGGDEGRLLRAAVRGSTEARQGEPVKLRGRVRLVGEALTAPMTETRCAAYELWIEHRRPHREGRRREGLEDWADADARVEATAFVIEDQSGAALVDATADTVVLLGADEEMLFVGDDRARVLEALSGRAQTHLVEDHDFRYREWCLTEGMEVAVLGRVTGRGPVPIERGGYRDEREGPRLEGTFEEPIVVSDRADLVGG